MCVLNVGEVILQNVIPHSSRDLNALFFCSQICEVMQRSVETDFGAVQQ